MTARFQHFGFLLTWVIAVNSFQALPLSAQDESLSEEELQLVEAVEQARIRIIEKVKGSVVAIYGDDKQGGGSGVIIDPSGIALTNHHVIMGAGVNGWGGLADGKLYRWKLIGTDPGGDVSLIQLEGKKRFPFSRLGDSDRVRVGDWAFAMGNPFVLTEDQSPTVTLGIVSGIERYQGGTGQTGNQLVYGNCIQMDSSINPGNSGGPLFNMNGEIIGINGRGSFQDRGRVNVGLGYAISSNQIKNFIPDLLATKLTEHGTLDAHFSIREGKLVCSTLDLDSPVAERGLELGDELLEFEGIEIRSANHFKNLICTLPEDWPAHLKIRKSDGKQLSIVVRLLGLPYAKPKPRPQPAGRDGKEPTPEQKRAMQKQKEMVKLLSADAGTIRNVEMNQIYASQVIERWLSTRAPSAEDQKDPSSAIKLTEQLVVGEKLLGSQKVWLAKDGRFRMDQQLEDSGKKSRLSVVFDGKTFWRIRPGKTEKLSPTQAKLDPVLAQAVAMLAPNQEQPFNYFGKLMLDGTGKAMDRAAYRMKLMDANKDWYFFWLLEQPELGNDAMVLAKASCDLDADGKSGAWIFANWKNSSGWRLPDRRRLVSGLDESLRMEVKTTRTEGFSEIDESLFSVADVSKESQK